MVKIGNRIIRKYNLLLISGVHHKKSDCDSNLVMDKVKNILKTASTYLFPAKLSVGRVGLKKKVKLKKGNGGWGDRRDHELCRNLTRTG